MPSKRIKAVSPFLFNRIGGTKNIKVEKATQISASRRSIEAILFAIDWNLALDVNLGTEWKHFQMETRLILRLLL